MNNNTAMVTQNGASAPERYRADTIPGLQQQLEKGAAQLRLALPAHIDADRFQRTVITAAQSNHELLTADRQSLLLAVMKCAQDGLLPDGREAALVIFNNREKIDGRWVSVKKVQYMPMVYGLRKKILQSGQVRDITAKVVYRAEYERGSFLYEEGTEAMLRHKPDLMLADEQSTDEEIVAAYSIATYGDGTKSYEVMSRAEINKVRQVSKTGAVGRVYDGKPVEPKGPWVEWFGEMAKKTVMRRHAKTLPMSGDLLDVEGREHDDALLIASSATAALNSQEPDAPVALPSRGDGDDQPAHDAATGEIIDQDGQSEEEIAQRLDNETFENGPPQGEPVDEPDQSAEITAGFTKRLVEAATVASVNEIAREVEDQIGALSNEDYDAIKAEIAAARTRLGAKPAK
jgi:recombination protein RecT